MPISVCNLDVPSRPVEISQCFVLALSSLLLNHSVFLAKMNVDCKKILNVVLSAKDNKPNMKIFREFE